MSSQEKHPFFLLGPLSPPPSHQKTEKRSAIMRRSDRSGGSESGNHTVVIGEAEAPRRRSAVMRRSRLPRACAATRPSKSQMGNVSVIVKGSHQVPGELGLYLAEAVLRGTVVCSFRCISLTYRQYNQWIRDKGLAAEFEDGGMFDLGRVLVDPEFTGPDQIPLWYRLNHSYFPNLEMRCRSGVVEWTAEPADIEAGAELKFAYGDPNKDWAIK